ncbi:MOSC domain-containing protein [Neobacillus terrae]|uniref:MOSC domain-containing protein n=1 Tax=Neobacillus terrae TaxID=3034837 RepID=UPI001409CC57|nr:MOSC domain-containing protein [Neobacillus terrae]NHM30889.1 MOSC domain-containing protein [Neobacillus terrae]
MSAKHTFSKQNQTSIKLLKGLRVEGDAHSGVTVKHRSRVAQNPEEPNLRQVHLIHTELFEELGSRYTIEPGQMGENITTTGLNLLELPKETILFIGQTAQVKITGLHNPCSQIDHFQPGLMKAVLSKDAEGNLVRKSGIMGIVLEGGEVMPGNSIVVKLPSEPFKNWR